MAGTLAVALGGATASPHEHAPASSTRAASVGPVAAADVSAAAAPDAAWLEHVSEQIRKSEYRFSADRAGGFGAPNRAQRLRGNWSDGALTITPRLDSSAWQFRYQLETVGRVGHRTRAEPAAPISTSQVRENRLEWTRADGLVEWYINDARGIEQGFHVPFPPSGSRDEPVVMRGRIDGLHTHLVDDRSAVILSDAAGTRVLQIRDLKIEDARGRELRAWFELEPSHLSLVFDDREAMYPVTVDPLTTSAWFFAYGEAPNQGFGIAVQTAGDVDGDGYSDLIVGAPFYDPDRLDGGRAYLYLGSPIGLLWGPSWTYNGTVDNGNLGFAVGTAGDVNGDGLSDIVIGAPGTGEMPGTVFVFHGAATGPSAVPNWQVDGDRARARFGEAVGPGGDFDGDGFDDVLVGAPSWGNPVGAGTDNLGKAFMYFGSASGLESTAGWNIEGFAADGRRGHAVAFAGDVNGDGLFDSLVSTPGEDLTGAGPLGTVSVIYGHPFRVPGAQTLPGDQNTERFGWTVGTAGDVDGDGFADIVIGAPTHTSTAQEQGRVAIYRGTATVVSSTPSTVLVGQQANARFGFVGPAGDVNCDGHGDIMVGAPLYDSTEVDAGLARVYLGSKDGLEAIPAWELEGDTAGAHQGEVVGLAGDVNGDGYSDYFASSPGYQGLGLVVAYHGAGDVLTQLPSWRKDDIGGYFGYTVAHAGDLDGDGFSEVLVGAPFVDDGPLLAVGAAFLFKGSADGVDSAPIWSANGEVAYGSFGGSVAGLGDVDGDGFNDILIGAPRGGDDLQGEAFIYSGDGIAVDTESSWHVVGYSQYSEFGTAVTGVGDLNGDALSDLAVGAPHYYDAETDTFPGAVLVFHGRSNGGPVYQPTIILIGEGDGDEMGRSVASAGDVDRDGYDDIIAGAPYHSGVQTDAGAAYLYLGSLNDGVGSTPDQMILSATRKARLGHSVSGAGDVDRDGYSDVVIGRPGNTASCVAGGFDVHRGQWDGLSAAASWSREDDEDCSSFGYRVASAGDVDGDGLSDILVGAPNHASTAMGQGAIYLFRGGYLTGDSAWMVKGQISSERLGQSFASAGDVNGDSFADAIIGSPFVELASVYLGNRRDGVSFVPQQFAADGSRPLVLRDLTQPEDGFRVRLNGRTPFGRAPVRAEWESKKLTEPLDGAGAQLTGFFDTGAVGPSGSVHPFDELDVSLESGVYRWRARLRSRTPLPWTSRWMSPAGNAETEHDLRSNLEPICTGLTVDRPLSTPCANIVIEANGHSLDGDPLTYTWFTTDCVGGTLTDTAEDDVKILSFADQCNATCTVSVVIQDGKGGIAGCTEVITGDLEPPKILVPPVAVADEVAGTGQATVLFTAGVDSVDDCDTSVAVTCLPASGSSFAVGETLVTCSGTDACGRFSDESFYVVVIAAGSVDTDEDGLLDEWEDNGITIDGHTLVLPGADSRHKTVYVEVDSMEKRGPTDLDDDGVNALDEVMAAFRAVPNFYLGNPDGENGIDLLIQDDERDIELRSFGPGTEDYWEKFRVFKCEHFGTDVERADPDWLKIRSAKALAYRYGVFANDFNGGKSGTSEIGGNDFMVTLGYWMLVTEDIQAGTFMHELGHTMGLIHGGVDQVNNKPNYHSVMNYRWQTPSVWFSSSWELDYSRVEWPPLNEDNGLDELVGISGHLSHETILPGLQLVDEYGPVDFNDDDDTVDVNVRRDVNGDHNYNILYGHADWENLSLKMDYDEMLTLVPRPTLGPDDELSYEEYLANQRGLTCHDGLCLLCPGAASTDCRVETTATGRASGSAWVDDHDQTRLTPAYSDALTEHPDGSGQLTRTWTVEYGGRSLACEQPIAVATVTAPPPPLDCAAPDVVAEVGLPVSFGPTKAARSTLGGVTVEDVNCWTTTDDGLQITGRAQCEVEAVGAELTVRSVPSSQAPGERLFVGWKLEAADTCGHVAEQRCRVEVSRR